MLYEGSDSRPLYSLLVFPIPGTVPEPEEVFTQSMLSERPHGYYDMMMPQLTSVAGIENLK